MSTYNGESSKKFVAIGLLAVLGGALFFAQSHDAKESAKKVCGVCAIDLGDKTRKEVFDYVKFNNEEYPVDSAAHKAQFEKDSARYAAAMHSSGLHEH